MAKITIFNPIKSILDVHNILQIKQSYTKNNFNLLEVKSLEDVRENIFNLTVYYIEISEAYVQTIINLSSKLKECAAIILLTKDCDLSSLSSYQEIDIIQTIHISKGALMKYSNTLVSEYSISISEDLLSAKVSSIKKYYNSPNINQILLNLPIYLISIDTELNLSYTKFNSQLIAATKNMIHFLQQRNSENVFYDLIDSILNIDLIFSKTLKLIFENVFKLSYFPKHLETQFEFKDVSPIKSSTLMKYSFELSNNYIYLNSRSIYSLLKFLNTLISDK